MDFPVSPQKNQALKMAMKELGLLEKDIQEEFVLSSGAGGQKINKTHSKVILTYHSKNQSYQIKCSQTREQIMNRYYARKMLVEEMSKTLGIITKDKSKLEKKKKNKRRRKKRTQLKYSLKEK